MEIIFWFGLVVLIILSLIDIFYRKVSNSTLVTVFLFGMAYQVARQNTLVAGLGVVLFWGLGYLLWKKTEFGGADAKLLTIIPLYLSIKGLGNLIGSLLVYMICLGIVSFIYGKVATKLLSEDKVPFIPAIAIAYVLTWILRT